MESVQRDVGLTGGGLVSAECLAKFVGERAP